MYTCFKSFCQPKNCNLRLAIDNVLCKTRTTVLSEKTDVHCSKSYNTNNLCKHSNWLIYNGTYTLFWEGSLSPGRLLSNCKPTVETIGCL